MPMAKFEPTDEMRERVAVMASGRLSQEEIAASITNPRTGRPITIKTLCKVFGKELKEDVEFKKTILEKFKQEVNAGNWQAIKYGMDHLVGFANGIAAATASNTGEVKRIDVRFVAPFRREPMPPDFELQPGEFRALPPPPPAEPVMPAREPEYAAAKPETPAGSPLYNTVGPPHCGAYRTEMDDPDVVTPWHKRKLTGKLRKGPLWGR